MRDDRRPVVLVGYCRGKISEGIDFPDHKARLVVVIGIPNPSLEALDIKLKKEFLDQKGDLSGKEWYNQ